MRTRLIDTIRLSYGLHWKHATPTLADIGITTKNLIALSAVLLIYGIAGSLDYANEKKFEAEEQQARADLQQSALMACLNGGSPGYYTIDDRGRRHYIVCETYTVSDENIKKAAL